MNRESVRTPLTQDSPSRDPDQPQGFAFLGFQDFKWRSVMGVVFAAQLAMYFISLWVVTPRGTLSPTPQALFWLGTSSRPMERCAAVAWPAHTAELRRWVVPIFLHASPAHIFLNLMFEGSNGPRLEAQLGPAVFAALFFVAGIAGNLLSDAFGINGVGGSTSCYGLLGADMVGWYRMWPSLDPGQRARLKSGLTQQWAMLIGWELINWKTIGHFGHLGGLIAGSLFMLGQRDETSATRECP